MTDRELLEAAARAAGIPKEKDGALVAYTDDGWHHWNPITDDGDALRLAVKLGLRIVPYPVYGEPKHSVIVDKGIIIEGLCADRVAETVERYADHSDASAAARRAITRAAAQIGAGMLPFPTADEIRENWT